MLEKLKRIIYQNDALPKENKKKHLYRERPDAGEPDEIFDCPKTK